jgi:excinuclease ABC subunit C
MTPEKLKNLTTQPGVYQMLDKQGMVIYVGKAKNLKKRVSSYFSKTHQDDKTRVLVANIDDFDVVITDTETQALLLENELIKQHKPRYNILLKDAKSYPYIYITNDKHPKVGFYRGTRHKNYQFFGPYPSAHVVRDSLNLLKKIFKVRQCANATYRARSRPCLEYQIALCSAPCVNKISDKDYAQDVSALPNFKNFL